jgi:cytochrome b
MTLFPLSRHMLGLVQSTSSMLPVLKLFLLPVGGGIPAGVLLARANGLAWPITTGLYLVSDMVLALAFEPILQLLAALGRKVPSIARLSAALKAVTARSVAHFSGTSAGPLTLVMIAFGVDPMTGRATALAAGHGFLAGWVFAIAGDMLYFAVIALTTLRLNSYFRDPNTTMLVVLGAMFAVPILVRFFRPTQIGLGDR